MTHDQLSCLFICIAISINCFVWQFALHSNTLAAQWCSFLINISCKEKQLLSVIAKIFLTVKCFLISMSLTDFSNYIRLHQPQKYISVNISLDKIPSINYKSPINPLFQTKNICKIYLVYIQSKVSFLEGMIPAFLSKQEVLVVIMVLFYSLINVTLAHSHSLFYVINWCCCIIMVLSVLSPE